MNGKIIVYLSKLFPSAKPVQTVQPTRVPTLGTQIGKLTDRAPDDYSHMFQGF